jgi:hypothetical protein
VSKFDRAVSRGHRNSARKRLGWCAPAERLSRASVQLGGDLVEARLIVPGQVRAFGKVLAQEPVAVLVRRALPRALPRRTRASVAFSAPSHEVQSDGSAGPETSRERPCSTTAVAPGRWVDFLRGYGRRYTGGNLSTAMLALAQGRHPKAPEQGSGRRGTPDKGPPLPFGTGQSTRKVPGVSGILESAHERARLT